MKILLLDNYDSFTYNLVHRLREVGASDVTVIRNDKIDLQELDEFSHIVLSSGPGIPREAGKMMDLISACREHATILGVCLGHQAIAESFGGSLVNLDTVVHGKQHAISVNSSHHLFSGLSETIEVGRYHSWVVDPQSLPDELAVMAESSDGHIMALAHKELPIDGIQFHPESIMTESGYTMLTNWITRKE